SNSNSTPPSADQSGSGMSGPGYPPWQGNSSYHDAVPVQQVPVSHGAEQSHTAWVPTQHSEAGSYPSALFPPAVHHQPSQFQPQYSQPYGATMPPQGFGQPAPAADQALPIPGLNAPGLNPLTFMSAGKQPHSASGRSNFFQGSQQYVQQVQQRMGWLSGGALNHYFAISPHYVTTKMLLLLSPYLKRWTYSRHPEQIQGGHKYRPPRLDCNAPDLYLPLVSAWAYVMLLALNTVLLGKFKPDVLYSMVNPDAKTGCAAHCNVLCTKKKLPCSHHRHVWYSGMSWAAHTLLAYALLRAMCLPASLPWAELLSYTGYSFLHCCVTLMAGMLAGSWAWRVCWAYGALCSAVFLVRTMKRVLFQEARSYGEAGRLPGAAVFPGALPAGSWLGPPAAAAAALRCTWLGEVECDKT
ncbi:hypothetical protein QJQ45_021702, partial [Haematococcus lacustris]